ncbi:MAG: 3TM-type holin [Pseudomonadota bacterium]
MRNVTGDPEETPIEEVAAKIQADPAKMVELQRIAADREVRLRELDSADLGTVNETMRSESKSEHWPQYSWRPYNGFLYGTSVVLIYFVLPLCGKTVPSVPEWIWIGWGAILGVTTWYRGKEKTVKAGDIKPGLIAGAIQALRR